MESRQPDNNTITPDEIAEAFSRSFAPSIGQLTFDRLRLEKQVQALQSHLANVEMDSAQLKAENSSLVTNHIQLEGLMHSLEKELEDRPTPEDIMAFETAVEALEIKIGELVSAGPTLAQSAAADVTKTEARNEKAAPD